MSALPQTVQESRDWIFHITARSAWERALTTGDYRPESLANEGFIHCSQFEQVVGTAQRYFAGHTDLVLLCIDPEAVNSEIRYEAGRDSTLFPHIYGSLNLEAVVQVIAFDARATALPRLGGDEPNNGGC